MSATSRSAAPDSRAAPARTHAEYLQAAGGVLCLRTTPPGPASPTGVVVVPPFGWDEVASYAARRLWAEELARAGHHVLRLDLPGTGDSAGDLTDPDRLAGWSAAVAAAAGRLRGDVAVTRVAAIGVGLGGLVAALAVADGAPIDDLVLWATPVDGRGAVRRLRALARLQGSRAMPGEVLDELPTGWLEVGGSILSAELMASLEAVDLRRTGFGSLQRALLVAADGKPSGSDLRAPLEADGVEVTQAAGGDYDAMVDHPEHVTLPRSTADVVAGWLAQASAPSSLEAGATPALPRLELDGGVHETPLWIQRSAGRLFGVLTEPSIPQPESEACLVLLNAGAIRRSGPNRMWVEAARRAARQGVPTLRLDLPAIGDSDGDPAGLSQLATLHEASIAADVRAALDVLQNRGLGSRIALGGLCSGAYHAFHGALADERVVTALLLNPRALAWDEDVKPRQDARQLTGIASAEQWRRLLRGEISWRTVVGSVQAARRLLGRRLRRGGASLERPAEPFVLETAFGQLESTGVAVVVGFSGGEPLRTELQAQGLLEATAHRPWLSVTTLPGRDHELRPVAAQRAAHELVDEALVAARQERGAAQRSA